MKFDSCSILLTAALVLASPLLPVPAGAEVERVVILSRDEVADGRAFGLAGKYEKLRGKVYFALDPTHPENQKIIDLDKAPRGDDGRVRFASDLYALQPTDPNRGNGSVLLEVSNRGTKTMLSYLCRKVHRTLDPTTVEDFGDAFLLRRGFTLVWVGWQSDVPDTADLLRRDKIQVEIDTPIEGSVRADQVFREDTRVFPLGDRQHHPYEVANPEDSRNVLTVRESRLGQRQLIPRERWRFARLNSAAEVVPDRGSILLEGGFSKGKIYEAVYVAQNPSVVGLGFATIRDLVSHLKYGTSRTVKGQRVIAFGISQTGRFLRSFLYQGFNRDENNRVVLDGAIAHAAGAGRGSFNHRFAQPSRDAQPFSAFFYPTDLFPFTGKEQLDPETSMRDGLWEDLRSNNAMPKVFLTNTGYDYWGRAAALIHIAVDGARDIEPVPEVRIYHLASTQHFVDRFPPTPRSTRYPANSADFLFFLRALIVAMDAWVTDGIEPPPSRFPQLKHGTLVQPGDLRFPAIPGIETPCRPHEAYRVDYGEHFQTKGIVSIQPPKVGNAFPVFIPQVDREGNEMSGLRLPEIAVPLATYTSWNWRAEEIGAAWELANYRGSFLPFPRTESQRKASGDPRLSIAERYHSRDEYLGSYARAAVKLVAGGYLLPEDLPELIEHANRLWNLVQSASTLEAPVLSSQGFPRSEAGEIQPRPRTASRYAE